MAVGNTTRASLADSQNIVIDSARIVREYEGTWMRTTETHKLPKGTGKDWDEVDLAALTAQDIDEDTVLDNPQQISDSIFRVEPAMIGIQTIMTKKAQYQTSPVVYAKIGKLAQNAMQRKKNDAYLTLLQSGATTASPGAGATLTRGHVSAAKFNITSNTTEGSVGRVYGVLHGFQLKDLYDEITAGIGTYPIPSGMTEAQFKSGMIGECDGVTLYEDGNITIDGSADAQGGIHTKEAVVYVQGFEPRTYTRERPDIGGGADEMFMYDDFQFGERSAGNWLMLVYSDATAPTS